MVLLECVPNMSEGRRAETIAGGAEVIRAAGASLLDLSADGAHHRAVYTFAGDAPVVESAALALLAHAIATIDLRTHVGVHPRIGALDVVPFVPLGKTSMAEAVAVARRVGAEAARRFDLPIFLYEAAATTPARRALEHIRGGQFEGLDAKLRQPEWAPDFGPRHRHPSAGATAIGARRPLIAFNVNLATDRLDIAQAIARAVRERDGGLPSVKAMGVPLVDAGAVQVSMNLTNFEVTPPLAAFRAVTDAAARYGVGVLRSELIGLIPAAALPPAGAGTLGLEDFRPTQILEDQLRAHGLPG